MSSSLRVPVNLLIELNAEQVAMFARQHDLDPGDRRSIVEQVTAVVADRARHDPERLTEPMWDVERRSARDQGGV